MERMTMTCKIGEKEVEREVDYIHEGKKVPVLEPGEKIVEAWGEEPRLVKLADHE